jgi:hypothetical protein
MEKFNFKTVLASLLIPTIIIALTVWRAYSTMDVVYAKKVQVYEIDKKLAMQSKDYEMIRYLLDKIDKKVDVNHLEIKKLIEKYQIKIEGK